MKNIHEILFNTLKKKEFNLIFALRNHIDDTAYLKIFRVK